MSPDSHVWFDGLSGDSPADPPPDHPSFLKLVDWQWTTDHLLMAEYVGYPLYLRLRDRMQSLRLPTQVHDTLIQEMIDMHDVEAIDTGTGRSIMIVRDQPGLVQPVEVMGGTEFDRLTAG